MFKNLTYTKDWKIFSILLAAVLLFVFSPFYAQANSGGTGLSLTYNIAIWGIASWIIIAGVILVASNAQFIYPSLWYFFIIFPLFVLISSLVSDYNQPITWLFRQLYIFGGALFLFVLFQLQAKKSTLDHILFILVIATGLHAVLGTMQIVAPNYLSSYFPPNNNFVPRGMFQQINVQASFLATGLIMSLYLISRPSFKFTNIVVKFLVVIAFTLGLYIVVASGSRVGLLSLLLAIPLIVWSRFQQLKVHKPLLIILLVCSCGSFLAGQAGLHKTLDKTAQLTEKSYSTSRVAMYTIGMELVAQEPVHGYGIGGFLKAWNTQASDFISRHPETLLPTYVTHPHNEILFWMIEAGLPALLGIIAFMVGICVALYRCGFQRGSAYAAMLLPISLHTQVELPFYISSLHWFVWLFLIYLVLSHHTKTVAFNLSQAMTRFVQISAPAVALGITLFMINTARAELDIYNFTKGIKSDTPPLSIALNNLYTKNYAEQLAMRSMLYASIQSKDRKKIEIFEDWAMNYVKKSPELKMYEDLISASVFLRPEGKGCDAILAALAMYAHNEPLQKASEQCAKD